MVKNIEFLLYDGKDLHGEAKGKIQTIFKPKKKLVGKEKFIPITHVYGTHSVPMFKDDHKPVGNLNVKYVFIPTLMANELEKGQPCEYN